MRNHPKGYREATIAVRLPAFDEGVDETFFTGRSRIEKAHASVLL
jgi:hypothetical protein